MTALYALLTSLVTSAAGGPSPAMLPGREADVARAYMRLIQTANAFEVDEALEARRALYKQHGEVVDRIGVSEQLSSLDALGEPFPMRAIEWWQGEVPEKDERYLVVWWHPMRSTSRRVVLGAQAIGQQHGIPVVAIIPDGVQLDRKAAAEMVAICPTVTFATAPARLLDEVDLDVLPRVTVVESGRVLWQGAWEQLAFTPLAP